MAVTDDAILGIKEMIVSGTVKPGQKLPPEKELSELLGLSRSSLREAVKALEVIRVLDVRRGDGTYVTSLEPAMLLEAMSFVVELHQDDSVLELFEVRRMLEPDAVALAAAKASPEQVAEMRQTLETVDEQTAVEDLVAHDTEFHARLAAASGNGYLASLLESLSSRTVRARVWRGITEGGSTTRTIDEHRGILDAVERGEADLARALMLAHISGVERWLRAAPFDSETSDQ